MRIQIHEIANWNILLCDSVMAMVIIRTKQLYVSDRVMSVRRWGHQLIKSDKVWAVSNYNTHTL